MDARNSDPISEHGQAGEQHHEANQNRSTVSAAWFVLIAHVIPADAFEDTASRPASSRCFRRMPPAGR